MKYLYTGLLFFGALFSVMAGGIKGVVRDKEGLPLPYASIYVVQSGSGAATDINGQFELSLPPGTYDLAFKYVGYETIDKKVEIGADFITMEIIMKAAVMELAAFSVTST